MIRPYTGPGFLLTATAVHEIGEPNMRMSAPTKAPASAAPARRAKAPDLNLGKFYAMRRQAVQEALNAAQTERATEQNIFQADGAAAVYSARGNRT